MRKQENILLLCNSVYQVMMGIHLVMTHYKNDKVDIIVSDTIKDYEDISKRIKATNLFNQVLTGRIKTYSYYEEPKISILKKCYFNMFPYRKITQYVNLKNSYDTVLFSSLNRFSKLLINVLKNNKLHSPIGNKKIRLILYEDGTATYSKIYEERYYNKKFSTFTAILKSIIFHKISIYGNIDELLVFEPSLICWKPPFPIKAIAKLTPANIQYRLYLNQIFDYEKKHEKFNRGIIYFEDSYHAMGHNIDDFEVLERIAAKIGKEKIIVKVHPRSNVNRFKEAGYFTNSQWNIPFELYLLNQDFSDYIFVTVGSGSVSNAAIIFSKQIMSISIMDCLREKPLLLEGDLQSCIEAIYQKSAKMYIPKSVEEAIVLIEKHIKITNAASL